VRVVTLLSVFATVASAQQQQVSTVTPGTAMIAGAVFDSVRIRPLAGAIVRVDTSDMFSRTDSDGRFRIEGIPPGMHALRVEHPLLDTLGIALRSETLPFAAGEAKVAELATPAPETLLQILCSPQWRTRGPAALVGRVREADNGGPATGAKVSLVWYELAAGTGLRRVPRVRESLVGPDGTYRICGLPTQLDGKVQVLRGTLTSGEIAIGFGEDLLALRSMSIAAPDALIAAAPGSDSVAPSAARMLGTARLTGRVLTKSGQPLARARVQLEGTTRATVTRQSGEFVLDSLPPGTQSVAVRMLGYAPIEHAVDLVSRESRSVTITMTDFVPVLGEIRVTAQRERALDGVGYARRKRVGIGTFLDGDQINRASLNFTDVLRNVPGLRIMPAGNGRYVVTDSRNPNGCVNIWVDGTQWQQLEPGDVDDFLKPHEIGAIEVYSGTNAPVEYQTPGRGSCATVVAWTFRRLDRKR
jgi:hypothetical protein